MTKWLDKWQELVAWLPIALVALGAAWWLIPTIDPRSGIDGLGSLYGLALAAVHAVVVLGSAWLSHATYGYVLDEEDEKQLHIEWSRGAWSSGAVIIWDRMQVFAWVGVMAWLLR